MASHELGVVVAERHLEFIDAEGIVAICRVKVGQPIPDANEDWICPYQIEAGQRTKTFGMHGIDSLQALVLTLKTLDVEIEYLARKMNSTVRFLDEGHVSVFSP